MNEDIRVEITTERVVFLDIDGVLAPIRAADRYGDFDPACVAVLNEIVVRSGAVIVVSSSLRYGKTLVELQRMLDEAGFAGRVVDMTPTDRRGGDRGEEIAAWLEAHSVREWVILDDHRDMGSPVHRLVQTNAAAGLCTRDAERALAILAISDPLEYN